ncbi:MAG: hypothetical protein JXB50_12235 [Spirochaetes bacterium]|nr:hypothetical protein [Spirochaetota bacterium]
MPKEFLIFEKGKYPQGDYSNIDILSEFVERFNNTKIRMSCFIGHKYPWQQTTEDDELAHGEITNLRINQRGQIYAVDYDLDDYLKEKIAKKQLLFCSPEIYGDPNVKIDIAGLAFLGRSAPQNPFALLPQLFNFKTESKIQDNLIGTFKFENDFFKSFSNNNKINKEDENPMTEDEKKMFQDTMNIVKNTASALESVSKRLETIEKTQSDFNRQNKTEDSKTFFQKLIDEGKLPPVMFEKVSNFDSKLNDELKPDFRSIFLNMEKIVDTSGAHFAQTGNDNDAGSGDVTAKIKAFQAENKIKSFEAAAEAYFAKNPKAFEGGN